MTDYENDELYCAGCGLVITERLYTSYNPNGEKRKIPLKTSSTRELIQLELDQAYEFFSKCGLIHHGNVRSKEPVKMYLTKDMLTRSIVKSKTYGKSEYVFTKLTALDLEQCREGGKILIRNILRVDGIQVPPSELFDNYRQIDFSKMDKCLNPKLGKFTEEIKVALFVATTSLLEYIRERIEGNPELGLKWLQIPKNHAMILLWICMVRWVEKIVGNKIGNKKVLRDDIELRKILGIPRSTYLRKKRK